MQSDGSYTKNQILNEKKKYIQEKLLSYTKKKKIKKFQSFFKTFNLFFDALYT